jgi:hypothetical protein
MRILTIIKCLQFVAGYFGIVHAFKKWLYACVVFTPEVICNYDCKYVPCLCPRSMALQDIDTVGPSITVPGMLLGVCLRQLVAFASITVAVISSE